METAKSVRTGARDLLERIEQNRKAAAALLDSAKAAESRLVEKEARQRKIREEKEKAERLQRFLESGETGGYVADAEPEPQPEPPAPKAAEPAPAPKEEVPPVPETRQEEAPQPAPAPAPETAPAPRPAAKAEQPARTEQPAQPVQQPASARKPAYDGNRQPRNDRPQQQRPQGSFQQRPQQGQGRPQTGSGQQRPQGGYQSRTAPADMTPGRSGQRSGIRAVVIGDNKPAENKRPYETKEKKAKNKKAMQKEAAPDKSSWDDEGPMGNRRKAQSKKPVQAKPAPVVIEHAVITGDAITVKELSEKIGKPAAEIIKKLFLLGIMATINQDIDFDTCELIASDYNITLEKQVAKTFEDVLADNAEEKDSEDQLVPRPPVVTIMGHVDHGKTSLLDAFRHSSVAAGEAGGITQHIGAYTVKMNGRDITFLDTPGHEAFTAMRARGAQATDIAILVVAADDSVMPQTIEAINHAKAANVPIIVAINKMDKPEADPERVKTDLTKYGIVCEDWGGDTIMCPVSAKTGEGVDELLEMILLQADTMELRANPNRLGRGVIIEAKLDKARGPLATVLMQNGTLHVGDNIIAGLASGRVRALINDRGEKVKEAGPSTPVEIMGFDEVPSAGDEMQAVGDDRLSRQVAEERKAKVKASREATMAKVSLENMFSNMESGKQTTLNLIIKADVQGSVEAVKQAMEKLSSDEVKVHVLHSAAGAITKDDVNLASAFNAIIIGFNIRPDASAREAAEREKVDVRLYTVIYKAIEDMELAMKGLLAPEYREVLLGHAEVRNVFKITGAGVIAGCYVTDGKVQRNAQVRLLRDNVVVFEGKLSSLKHYKEDVKEMAAGFECGMSLEGHNDIKEGDVVECFIMEEIPR